MKFCKVEMRFDSSDFYSKYLQVPGQFRVWHPPGGVQDNEFIIGNF